MSKKRGKTGRRDRPKKPRRAAPRAQHPGRKKATAGQAREGAQVDSAGESLDALEYSGGGPLSSMRALVGRTGGHSKDGFFSKRRPLWQWAMVLVVLGAIGIVFARLL